MSVFCEWVVYRQWKATFKPHRENYFIFFISSARIAFLGFSTSRRHRRNKFTIWGHICYSKFDLKDMPIDQMAIKLHPFQFYWFCTQTQINLLALIDETIKYKFHNKILDIFNYIFKHFDFVVFFRYSTESLLMCVDQKIFHFIDVNIFIFVSVCLLRLFSNVH